MRDRLLLAASTVRRALEQPWVTFDGFPRGYCQGASKLLAKYLVEIEGICPVEGVANGTRHLPSDDPDWPIEQSHFWLEQSCFIVDITADQFDDCAEPVIVTTDCSWHAQFQGQTRVSQEDLLNLNYYLGERYARMMECLRTGWRGGRGGVEL
jgi:hypothetical protein